MTVRDHIVRLRENVEASINGQADVVESLIVGLLADGHLLLEGLPGLAKTRAVKSMARELEATMSRVQFTPDLLPSDVTGTVVYHAQQQSFRFEPGPIFGNIVLVDEINRAPAKVQAALLEAMEERQVTIAGETHAMPPLFMVLATQNPIEQEGTYPLPEAQLDRFLMHVRVHYPKQSAELEILKLVRGEQKQAGLSASDAKLAADVVFEARREVNEQVNVGESVDRYIVDLVLATRAGSRPEGPLNRFIDVGASPRATIALDRCARAHAWLNGHEFVTPDNVRAVAHAVLRHRLILSFEANAEGVSAHDVVTQLLDSVAISG